jgi:hypothetical protein
MVLMIERPAFNKEQSSLVVVYVGKSVIYAGTMTRILLSISMRNVAVRFCSD